MNTGAQTIEWLFGEQLKVDDEWAVRTPSGFRWWADRQAQTIEVIGEEASPEGETEYLVAVRTELVRSIDLDERTLSVVNAHLMSLASMAGPVYDRDHRLLSLCSLVKVHDQISPWMNPLISMAAVLQIGEARIMAPAVAQLLDAEVASSGHPQHGLRPDPDELAAVIATLIAPTGREPSRWPVEEFRDVVDRYMKQPPALLATAGDRGFTVEFPWADESSLCQVMADQPHPRYGNGLFVWQSFPVPSMSEGDGIRLALAMNEIELAQRPFGYGFGSYAFRNAGLHFTAFLPNAIYRPGLLPNIYFSSGQRARELAVRFTGCEWTPESCEPRRSAIGRMMDQEEGPRS